MEGKPVLDSEKPEPAEGRGSPRLWASVSCKSVDLGKGSMREGFTEQSLEGWIEISKADKECEGRS